MNGLHDHNISDHCLAKWCPLLTACPPPGPPLVEAPPPCARRGWVRGPRPRCCSTAWGRWPPGPGWCAAGSAAPPRCRSQGGWAALKHRKCISTCNILKSKWPSLNCWINFHLLTDKFELDPGVPGGRGVVVHPAPVLATVPHLHNTALISTI